MKIGVPKEIKTNENRVALVPAGAEALVVGRPQRERREGRGRRLGLLRRDVHEGGREDRADRRRRVGGRRHDHEGEGADRARVEAHEEGADDLHLLPLRGRREAHEGAHRERRGLHRVRDRGAAERGAAAADAHERGGGADGGAGGGQVPREAARRAWRAAGRRAGRAAGQGRDPGRRCGGHECREDGGGAGRESDDPRSLPRAAALSERRDAGERADGVLEPAHDPRADLDGRSRRGRGARRGREGAAAHSSRGPEGDAARAR